MVGEAIWDIPYLYKKTKVKFKINIIVNMGILGILRQLQI